MELSVDREAPRRLARGMLSFDEGRGQPIFCRSVADDIHLWRATRQSVYQHLMLAPRDFAGKLMILFSTVRAFEERELTTLDWGLTDDQLMGRLLDSGTRDVRETATRWITGEFWDFTPLVWMDGDRPDYPRLLAFSKALSERLDRGCFAYGIKDKRDRRLTVQFYGGSSCELGEESHQWLLGIGSPVRKPFDGEERRLAWDYAASVLGTKILGPADQGFALSGDAQSSLF